MTESLTSAASCVNQELSLLKKGEKCSFKVIMDDTQWG